MEILSDLLPGPIFHVPNGAGPDTAAIRQKLEEAKAAGGGVVLLEPGTYELDEPLVIPGSNIVLRGAGMDATKILFTWSVFPRYEFKFHYPKPGDIFYRGDTLTLFADPNGKIMYHSNSAHNRFNRVERSSVQIRRNPTYLWNEPARRYTPNMRPSIGNKTKFGLL